MANTPNTIFAGDTGPEGNRPGPDSVAGRAAMYIALAIFFPVAVIVYLIWLTLFTYARLPWWVPAPVAGVTGVLALATGQISPNGIKGIFNSITKSFSELFHNKSAFPSIFLHLILSQFILSIFLATAVAACAMAWKWVRAPRWQEKNLVPGPVLKKRLKDNRFKIQVGEESPVEGITLGLSQDIRDPRFANGKPGAPYGARVVVSDAELSAHTLVVGGSGSGKALDIRTLVLTNKGFKPMGSLIVGDTLCGSNGQDVSIIGAYDTVVDRDCFEINFSDGTTIIADTEHLWAIDNYLGRAKREMEMSTESIVLSSRDIYNYYQGDPLERYSIFISKALQDFQKSQGLKVSHLLDSQYLYILDIQPTTSVPVRCIAVDAQDQLFLAGVSLIPTHNTSTMLVGMRDVIRLGRGLIIVDCKGDPKIPVLVSNWARRYDREFLHWSIQDPKLPYTGPAEGLAYYDPISRGDASRRKDLLIGSQRWDMEYYKSVVANYLQTAFSVMDLVPPLAGVDTFSDLADLLSPAKLIDRSRHIVAGDEPELTYAIQRMSDLDASALSGIQGMYGRIQTLTSSTAGNWLRRDPNGLRDINFKKVADEGQIVVFSLDSSSYEDTVTLIAGLIIQDLKTLSTELRIDPALTPLHIYIDEFSAIDTVNLLGLISKARDAKMPVTLATQALADLERKDPAFVDQVLSIVSSFVIHRANTETDARTFAGLSGVVKKRVERIGIEQTTGGLGTFGAVAATGTGYSEERDDYAVPVGTFQQLKQGYCVFIAKSPVGRYVNPVEVVQENEHLANVKGDPRIEVERKAYKDTVASTRKTYPHPANVDRLRFRDKPTMVASPIEPEVETIAIAPSGLGENTELPVSQLYRKPTMKPTGIGKQAGSPIPMPLLSKDSTLSQRARSPMPKNEITPIEGPSIHASPEGLNHGSHDHHSNTDWMTP